MGKSNYRSLTTIGLISMIAGVLLTSGCVGDSTIPQSEVGNTRPQTDVVAGWGIKNISPEEAYDLIQSNRNNLDFIIIDVRLSKWLAYGYIEGAVNIPLNTSDLTSFEGKVVGLGKNKTYLTYCPDGCGAAARIMSSLGFDKIYDIEGGYSRWLEEGLPIVE